MYLRYLHLADLHLVAQATEPRQRTTEQINQELVTSSMLEAIETLARGENPFDLVLISGDSAYHGQAEEYNCVEAFCQDLLRVTGLDKDRLFIVPGNHDIDRRLVKKAHLDWWYKFSEADQVTNVLSDPDSLGPLMRKFTAFYEFSNRMLGYPVDFQHDYGYAKPVPVTHGSHEFLVNIAGLNSALFAGYDGDDQKKLAFGWWQVEKVLQHLDPAARLTIALFHHPLDCFHSADRHYQHRIRQRCDLILTGHVHDPNGCFQVDRAGPVVWVSAGAGYEGRDRANSFNVVEIDLENRQGTLQFFKYLPQYHTWVANAEAFPGFDQGIYSFTFGPSVGPPRPPRRSILPKQMTPDELAKSVLGASTDGRDLFRYDGGDLKKERLPSEGVILIKPAGTFNYRVLQDIFRRIVSFGCVILQIRVFDGQCVKRNKLFMKQYPEPTKLAKGETPLEQEDLKRARGIYGVPEFQAAYQVEYADTLIVPAYQFMQEAGISEFELTKKWDEARSEKLFHNNRYDGLNKIGYQKSVYPIKLAHSVTLVLNGYIPGYQALFEDSRNRVVALWVTTDRPWQDVRDVLVGGKSAPAECEKGSIRWDAYHRVIAIPEHETVNGQRNVAHSSANLLEGARELGVWFGVRPEETIVGGQFSPDIGIERLTQLWAKPGQVFVDTRGSDLASVIDTATREVWHIATEAPGRKESMDKIFRRIHEHSLAHSAAGQTDMPLDMILRNPVLSELAAGGVDLELAGLELYKVYCSRSLSHPAATEFGRAADHILGRYAQREIDSEVAAEALKIVASDAYLLCGSGVLRADIHDLVTGTRMADEAVHSATRIRGNAVTDIWTQIQRTSRPDEPAPRAGISIRDSEQWRTFQLSPLDAIHRHGDHTPPGNLDLLGLILAGGRSTRVRTTVPKAVLPVGDSLMLDKVLHVLREAGAQHTFCAAGWRHEVLEKLVNWQPDASTLIYQNTPGLGFRVATCLHELAEFSGYIILTYCDMTLLHPQDIVTLVQSVRDQNAIFGMLTARTDRLSGNVIRDQNGRIVRVVQTRLAPEINTLERDLGVYVMRNDEAFREALLNCTNDNPRKEYIFADVVEQLTEQGLPVVDIKAERSDPVGINTPQELVFVGSGLYQREKDGFATQRIGSKVSENLKKYYNLSINANTIVRDVLATMNSRQQPALFLWES